MAVLYLTKYNLSLWCKFLPLFQMNSPSVGDPYNYFTVYLQDAENTRHN